MEKTVEAKLEKKLELIVEYIAKEYYVNYVKISNGYVLDIPVEYIHVNSLNEEVREERRQFVYLTWGRKSPTGEDLFQVFSICGPVNENLYRSALMLNQHLTFGSYAVARVEVLTEDIERKFRTMPRNVNIKEESKDTLYFVVVDTYIAAHADVKQIRHSAFAMAKAGDKMERMLIGKDIS